MWGALLTLVAVGTPAAVALALLFGALANPQKTVYWISQVGALFGWASAGIARRSLAGRLESRINDFAVYSYRTIQHVDANGARISWVQSDAEVSAALNADGDLVVYLNPSRPEGENLARAALMYVAEKFVPRAKLHMTPRQRQSMDLFVTGRLLDRADEEMASQFFSAFMGPATVTDDKLAALVEDYHLMDRAGLFFPVFVQELVFMGEKVALGGARRAVGGEVRGLLDFLRSRANRVIGDDTVPMSYEGTFCKCGLVIVAKADKLRELGIDPYVQAIAAYASDGYENVYVMGGADTQSAIDEIVDEALVRTRLIEVVRKEYDAEVQQQAGAWRKKRHVLVLLRSASVQRYMNTPREAVTEGSAT
jgi:uncharacterized protein YdhG (YjbR/CyaY superfamily)